MTTIPATQGVIREQTFNITSVNTDITLIGPESFIMLYLPVATDPLIEIVCWVQPVPGGSWLPAPLLPLAPITTIPHTRDQANLVFFGNGSRIGVSNTVADLTNRAFFIVCTGAHAVRFSRISGTTTGAVVRHVVGPPPYVQALTKSQRMYGYEGWSVSNGVSYASGVCIGGTQTIPGDPPSGAWQSADVVAKLRHISWGDYAAGFGDLDVIIMTAGSATPLADGATLNIDYPEAILAWFEFRAAPTAGQYPTHDAGASGGLTGVVTGLDIDLVNPFGGNAFDAIIVSRAAITPSAGSNFYAQAVMEV